ncbi:unnamed protein product [Schistosoma rodhaini]|uniref:N-acetyltransferase domain-containing protein n=1 Tax=Schistosoma rodhaini TaxID=6188 RepID=A0AA85FIL5_9TREM|nr:unnamed protein product [Schistosoma rodhaini]CAH8521199.1 unnamed protein product [Schistosoma rodhaini]
MSEDVKLSTELNKVVLTEKCRSEEEFQPHEPLFKDIQNGITFRQYIGESDLNSIINLIANDLSEPYSIYTYRYFIYNWPKLCLLAVSEDDTCVGTIVCKMETHLENVRRGYIAMLAVEKNHRRIGIGSRLVQLAIELMIQDRCDEIVLEAEVDNKAALSLYEQLGFYRDKRLIRYYLNGRDAFRLKLWLTPRMSNGVL